MLDELKTLKNSLKKLYKINRKGYFYTVTKSNSMTRMNLSQLIQFLINENQPDCAEYFACFPRGEQVPGQVVDGLIDANLVKWYFNEVEPSGLLLRKIQANVTSYIGYNSKYYQNPSTGEQWTEAQYLEYVAFEEDRHNADNFCEDCHGCEKCEG